VGSLSPGPAADLLRKRRAGLPDADAVVNLLRKEFPTGQLAEGPSSMAACSVQRPLPESETWPPKFFGVGSFSRAKAVKSSSQEAMTLRRRHRPAARLRRR
jgi:hypothetical protein